MSLLAMALMLPRPAIAATACDELRIVSGTNKFVPATVTLAARASEPVGSYTFYFGDGQQQKSDAAQVTHTYTESGTHTARVAVGNSSCQVIFSLLQSPFESQKSGCSDVFIQGGDNFPTGTNVKFLVTGYDNKSGIKGYKIDFGNGQIKESNVGNFDLTFTTPGTFTIKGYVMDSKGVVKGGEGSCQTPLYITGPPLQSQPATGTPTWFTVAGILSGVWLFFILKKRRSHRR